MIKPDTHAVLAGDVGGTKTNLGLFVDGKRRPRPVVTATFSSQGAPDLEGLVKEFLETHTATIRAVCFGVPGPVVSGRVRTTNLPWTVSEERIRGRFGWSRVRLVNDVAVTAAAIPCLRQGEVIPLNRAKVRKDRNMALIAPGTGLGQALLLFHDGALIPVSSEGGHVDFAPTTEMEIRLWQYLHRRWGHVSVERVVSGPGLVHIYAWLRASGRYREPAYVAEMFRQMDPAAAITRVALEARNPLCLKALRVFVSILGAVCGNLVLTGMATGGLYLGGGIPPKILPVLQDGTFMQSFTAKGRFRGLLEKVAVRVILNDKAALLGAAQTAFEMADRA